MLQLKPCAYGGGNIHQIVILRFIFPAVPPTLFRLWSVDVTAVYALVWLIGMSPRSERIFFQVRAVSTGIALKKARAFQISAVMYPLTAMAVDRMDCIISSCMGYFPYPVAPEVPVFNIQCMRPFFCPSAAVQPGIQIFQ